MEEREALKREIELLQNLIDRHKSVHGDIPFPGVEQRQPEAPTSARGHGSYATHAHSSRGRTYAPQSHTSWRKTYSLRNKNPQPSVSTLSSAHQSHSITSMHHSTSLPSLSRAAKTATLSPGICQQRRDGHVKSVAGIKGGTAEKKSADALRETGAGVSQHEAGRGGSNSTTAHKTLDKQTEESQQTTESRRVVLAEKTAGCSSAVPSSVEANTSTSSQSSPQIRTRPSPTSKTGSDTKRVINMTTPAGGGVPSLSSPSKQPSINPTSQVNRSFLKKSKFTWVKNQNVGASSSCSGRIVTFPPTSVSKAGAASRSPHSFTVSKRTPSRKFPRKLSPVTVAPKTSKYKWVSSSAGAHPKTSRKSLSPKSLTLPQRALEKGEAAKRLRAASSPSAKVKKETAGSFANSSRSSRYHWKAGGQSTSSAAAAGGATVGRRRSAFHWTSEKSNKGARGIIVGSPSVSQRSNLAPSSSPGAFKLRSRMKIIRKSASSGGGSEKGPNPSALKSSPRGRVHTLTRTPFGVRRTPSRELVSFGRHKLRRLSLSYSRTSPASSSHRGSASQREYGQHYRMAARPGSSVVHALHYNPALSWRAKRIHSARSFLQNRLRSPPHGRHPSSAQHWRGSSMCWIRGSLYRVSANKLSRTATSNMSINRTGRSLSTPPVSPMSPALNRSSSTRHLASRAVQRSLAIIRHARQKRQPKQYCMYYNRFGKCNRGGSCPYIHDPDKVAVCTRFLRGTCKQADGTCPFSHKVAKEKMPVCSYFLKGICNNSDCPYSHVYVSRKAEVCEDFVKGYCPEGEKCKKKHTLVCPDFSKTGSCPRGGRCKLQHRQRTKRSTSNASTSSTSTTTTTANQKRARTKETSKRPHLSVIIPQSSQAAPRTPTKGPLALPSFISLSSSPEEADTPDTPLAETSQVKGKKLQIKPRL